MNSALNIPTALEARNLFQNQEIEVAHAPLESRKPGPVWGFKRLSLTRRKQVIDFLFLDRVGDGVLNRHLVWGGSGLRLGLKKIEDHTSV